MSGDPLQKAMVKVLLFALYRGLRACHRLDPEVRRELEELPPDLVVELGVAGCDCGIRIARLRGRLVRQRKLPFSRHRLQIFFKNLPAALRLVGGSQRMEDAFCQNTLLVCGQIGWAVALSRCLVRVEDHLLPGFLKGSLILPEKAAPSWRIVLAALTGI